ncbi:hypothetical protein ACWD5E_28680, partial [Streptomyces californicus]
LIAEVDPDELPEEEDEFYDHQLIDLDVVLADTTDGSAYGRPAAYRPVEGGGPQGRSGVYSCGSDCSPRVRARTRPVSPGSGAADWCAD